MRRVDRILSNVLGTSKSINECKEDEGNMDVTNLSSDMDVTLLTDMNLTLPSDISFTLPSDISLTLPSQHVTITSGPNENVKVQETIILSNNIELHDDIESPIAPIYSPLTPLVTKRAEKIIQCEVREENSSPVPPMTPETFEIYQTLIERTSPLHELSDVRNEDYDTIETKSDVFDKHLDNNEFVQCQNKVSEFSNDTDPDFIPDSDEDLSDEDICVTSKKIYVNAVVHRSGNNLNEVNTNAPNIKDNEEAISSVDEITNSIIENESNNENCINDHLENVVEGLDEDQVSKGRPKKGRKRKYSDYTLRQRKQRKYTNLPYQGKSKLVESRVFRNYILHGCQKQCHDIIPTEKRQEEFQKYISLGSYEAQLLFIVNSVKETPKRRSYTVVGNSKTDKTRPKLFSRTYTIRSIAVCKDIYLNNFQITPKKVDLCLRKIREGRNLNDQRGPSVGGWNKTDVEEIGFVKGIINSLPRYESHYRRGTTSGFQYLKLGTTISKIYELYLEKHKEAYGDEKTPMTLSRLKRIFYSDFNLRCKTLKKDTCSRCDIFNNKINNCSGEEQEKLKKDKTDHLKRAKSSRNLMKGDLMRAKIDESFECITFDLEKTLPLPRIPTSIVFYKRQLWLYNCGVHSGSDDQGHCYVWIEGEAGRGSQEVGSCLIKYLKNKLDPKVQHLVLWSDCCGGQNRNIKITLMLKAILNSHPSLKTITFKYLESGHTFLPNDTDFSKIETQLKFHERLYTVDDYINVIKSAKKKNPLQVSRMEKGDFLSVKKMEKNIVNRKTFIDKTKVNWLLTKQILLKKESLYSIFMKTNNEQFQELNIEKKTKGKTLEITQNDFVPLWPNGKEIPQAKLDDIVSMFDLIPKDCLNFYKSLRGNANLLDDIDGFGGTPDFNVENQEDE